MGNVRYTYFMPEEKNSGFITKLLNGDIEFAISFWIYSIFIPIASFCFIYFVAYKLNDFLFIILFSLIFLYTSLAWIGTWKASRHYEGKALWRYTFNLLFIGLILFLLYIPVSQQLGFGLINFQQDDYLAEGESEEATFGPECNVAGLTFEGELLTYLTDDPSYTDVDSADSIIYELETAEANPYIEVILLEIDSPGGSPVAAQEITDTIKKTITKPVIVRIRGIGASAGYWVASAADRIFASKMSDIGSIGITMSYVDEAILNNQSGYTYNEINSGKYKDSGSNQRELTAEERAMFQRDVDIMYQIFIDEIAQNRNMSQEEVKALADGATMLGEMAKEKGLIDEVGMHSDVLNYIKETYQIEPNVCWL